MKKQILRTLACVLSISAFFCALAACKGNKEGDSTGDPGNSQDPASLVTFIRDGKSEYSIVYDASDPRAGVYLSACYDLVQAVKANAGVDLPLYAGNTGQAASTGGKEILVGLTDRSESVGAAKELRADDYVIRVMGDKLVILGGSPDMTAKAVERFTALYFSAPQTSLILESDYLYVEKGSYALESVSIGDGELKDYSIVYGENGEVSAAFLQERIRELYGYSLPLTSDRADPSDKEILVGATNRSESELSLPDGEYAVRQSGGRIVIAGGDANLVGAGVNAFVSGALSGGQGSISLDGLSLSGKIGTGAALKLFDLNVTLSGYAENAVVSRYPRLYRQIEQYAPDVICLQEVSGITWYDCITKGIGDTPALTDKYVFVGTPRNGSKPDYGAGLTGAYNAILYDRTLFKEEESGTFWLSETPDIPSVGWDGRTRAVCTWVRLTHLASGKTFAVMNTQPDSYGGKAPANGMALITQVAASFDCPVFLCGDFTAGASGSVYKTASSAGFLDSAAIANVCDNAGGTVNAYGSAKDDDPATDFIMTRQGYSVVRSYRRITDLVDEGYVSSHWAIMAEIGF